MSENLTDRLAGRLKSLRSEREWSLEQLATHSGVSRATLSRLENADGSPTTDILGKLCSAYGMTLSRLMSMIEDDFAPVVRKNDQDIWEDPESGFTRRVVSPPAGELAGEVISGTLAAGAHLSYEAPTVPGQEHHLIMINGLLEVTVDDAPHVLKSGDCLRYRLHGASSFFNPGKRPAQYFLVLI